MAGAIGIDPPTPKDKAPAEPKAPLSICAPEAVPDVVTVSIFPPVVLITKVAGTLIEIAIPPPHPAGLGPSGGRAGGALQVPGLALPQFGVVQTVTSWM